MRFRLRLHLHCHHREFAKLRALFVDWYDEMLAYQKRALVTLPGGYTRRC